jgi:hypothetical protein
MIEKAIHRLNIIIDKVPQILREISEDEISIKPSPNKWSKKEVLGHLIDSATNNHQRFIRGQFELTPEIRYDQNKWIEFSFYQEIESKQIINFWTVYNQQLVEIIKRIPSDNLTKQIRVGENLVTLEFLIVDYVAHLEHHLKQIIDY